MTKFTGIHCLNDFAIDSFKNDDDILPLIQTWLEIGAVKLILLNLAGMIYFCVVNTTFFSKLLIKNCFISDISLLLVCTDKESEIN